MSKKLIVEASQKWFDKLSEGEEYTVSEGVAESVRQAWEAMKPRKGVATMIAKELSTVGLDGEDGNGLRLGRAFR